MNETSQSFDVIIAGGGMVGMSMALMLARAGLRVAVLERGGMPAQLEASFDGRVSAISLGSTYILREAGAWQHMLPHAEPIRDIRVSDGATPFFLHYDHHEVGSDPFGYIVENRYIRTGLQQEAANLTGLSIIERILITDVTRDTAGVRVTLNSGQILHARLVIGADGRQSQMRQLAGIATTSWDYEQTAIVCTISHELPHEGLAQERFLPAGPFAVLPMTGNRSSLVWVEPKDRAPIYMELDEAEFVQEITERVGEYLGTIRTVGSRFTYPLSLLHANSYVGTRLALIGDAAHGIHPIAGQGVNLGFRDVADLSKLIIEAHKAGQDIGSDALLASYGRLRRVDNITMLAVTDGLNRLFTSDLVPLRLARDLGMWAVGKMPGLKRIFMRHAMGL